MRASAIIITIFSVKGVGVVSVRAFKTPLKARGGGAPSFCHFVTAICHPPFFSGKAFALCSGMPVATLHVEFSNHTIGHNLLIAGFFFHP